MPERRRYHTVREIMETFAPRLTGSRTADRAAVDKLVEDFRERLGVARGTTVREEREAQDTSRRTVSKP